MVTIEAKIEDIISFVGEKIAKSTLSIFLLYMREVEKFSTFFFFYRIKRFNNIRGGTFLST